jgi:hypothetical protein
MARRINFLAAEGHFVDHLAPVWNALQPSERGVFWVRSKLAEGAAKRHRINTKPWPGNVTDGTLIVCSAFGDLNQAYRAGATTVLMEHGAGQTYQSPHSSYAGGTHEARDNATLFLVPGRRPAEKLRAKHPGTPVVEIGCPKLDKRITRPPREPNEVPKVVFSFHWDCKVVPETRWAFPFFRRGIQYLKAREDIEILGHGHPRAMKSLKPFYESCGIRYIDNFETVLNVADAYACDNSSSIFEAAAVGIPVVLMNSPLYRRDIEHGLRFWEASNIGPNAEKASQLGGSIHEALNPTPEQAAATKRAVDLVYTHTDGTSAQRAAEAIRKHVL